jgi:hypothetical protein
MANSDAKPVVRKNAVARVYVPIYSTAGTLVTGGLTSITANVSKDGGSFNALASGGAAAEIGTTGIVAVDIAAADMNTDCTILRVTVANTDAVTAVLCLYPEEAGDIRVNLTQINSDSSLIAKFAAAVQANRIGTIVGTPTPTQIQCANLNDAQEDLYNGTVIVFLTGALAGSRATVTDYVKSGDNGVFTVSSQPTTASAGDLIVLF